MEIIPLTSPMKVRSPLGYRSTYGIEAENTNNLKKIPSRPEHVSLPIASIKTISRPLPTLPEVPHENLRRNSILSLKSLSMSLRLLKNRGGRSESVENVGMGSTTLETIDESKKSSIFKLDVFERNLKKFVSKSNEAEFQSYSEYTQNQQNSKPRPKTYFKNQKVYDRRSSMSDIGESNQNPPKTLNRSHVSTSSSNVKHEEKKKHKEEKKSADKTAEMLKEVRKRNMETAKRLNAPRRISTAY